MAKLEKELLEKEGEMNDIRWEKKESPGKGRSSVGSRCWVGLVVCWIVFRLVGLRNWEINPVQLEGGQI